MPLLRIFFNRIALTTTISVFTYCAAYSGAAGAAVTLAAGDTYHATSPVNITSGTAITATEGENQIYIQSSVKATGADGIALDVETPIDAKKITQVYVQDSDGIDAPNGIGIRAGNLGGATSYLQILNGGDADTAKNAKISGETAIKVTESNYNSHDETGYVYIRNKKDSSISGTNTGVQIDANTEANPNKNVKIDNGTASSTTDDNSYIYGVAKAINAEGDSVQITNNSGTIGSDGTKISKIGISLAGDKAEIDNSEDATITGTTAGIEVTSDVTGEGTIDNTGGTISAIGTTGTDGIAIDIAAKGTSSNKEDHVTIHNKDIGAITASAAGGIGIKDSGDYVNIQNGNADSATDGNYIYGAATAIDFSGENVTITNSGAGLIGQAGADSINISATGINLNGNAATVNNNTGATITGTTTGINITSAVTGTVYNTGGTISATTGNAIEIAAAASDESRLTIYNKHKKDDPTIAGTITATNGNGININSGSKYVTIYNGNDITKTDTVASISKIKSEEPNKHQGINIADDADDADHADHTTINNKATGSILGLHINHAATYTTIFNAADDSGATSGTDHAGILDSNGNAVTLNITGESTTLYNTGVFSKGISITQATTKDTKATINNNGKILGETAINIGANSKYIVIKNGYRANKKQGKGFIGNKDTTIGINVAGNNTTIYNKTGSSITGKTAGINITSDVVKGTINNTGGTISATSTDAVGIKESASYVTINNGTAGSTDDKSYIFGAKTAIDSSGANIKITNSSGTIGSDDTTTSKTGISLAGDAAKVDNKAGATITGSVAAIKVASTASGTIKNTGSATSTATIGGADTDKAIVIAANDITVTNTGVAADKAIITGKTAGIEITSGTTKADITNDKGTIKASAGNAIRVAAATTGATALGGGINITNKNNGVINGTTDGINTAAGYTKINNGGGTTDTSYIYGVTAAIDSSGTNVQITNNSGTIGSDGATASKTGISLAGATTKVDNKAGATITGTTALYIAQSGTEAAITNAGTIGTTDSTKGLDIDVKSTSTKDAIKLANTGTIGGETAVSIGENSLYTKIANDGTIGDTATDTGIAVNAKVIDTTGLGHITITNNSGKTIKGKTSGIDVSAGSKFTEINNHATITGTTTGINVIGDNTTINNYGNGLIESTDGDGIDIVGNNATINNNDKSTISGKTGIDISGNNATVINKSDFTVKGTDTGIKITGSDANITNSGTIKGTKFGINTTGTGTNITNNGTIFGSTAAIDISGKNATVTNNAGSVIQYTGAGKTYKNAAIYVDADATINNYGTIEGGGSIALNVDDVPARYGYAIAGTSATKQTVNVYDGSKFIGSIDLAANLPQVMTTAESDAIKHDVVNVYDTGSKGSYRFQVRHLGSTDIKIKTGSNAVKVDYRSNLIYVQNGSPDETVEVINASGAALRPLQLHYLTKNLHNAVRDHLEHLKVGKQSGAAKLDSLSESNSSKKFYQSTNSQVWGQVFGERVNRDAEGNVSAYENKLTGFIGGYQHDSDEGNVGMIAGYAKGNLTTTDNNQDDDTNSTYIGIYGQTAFGKLNLITALIAGQETHENHRKVTSATGNDIAKSDNNSLFLSPSVTLYSSFKLNDDFTLRPSTSLDYSAGRYGAYNETGADPANTKVEARTTDSALGKMQLELAYALPVGEIDLTAGGQYRYNDNKDIGMSISGSDFRYKSGIDKTVYGGYAGLGVNFDLSKKFHLTIASKYGKFSGDERQIDGKALLQYDF